MGIAAKQISRNIESFKEDFGCIHQWFEIKKTQEHLCEDKEHEYWEKWRVCVNYRPGVLVQCANCLKTKELYGQTI